MAINYWDNTKIILKQSVKQRRNLNKKKLKSYQGKGIQNIKITVVKHAASAAPSPRHIHQTISYKYAKIIYELYIYKPCVNEALHLQYLTLEHKQTGRERGTSKNR